MKGLIHAEVDSGSTGLGSDVLGSSALLITIFCAHGLAALSQISVIWTLCITFSGCDFILLVFTDWESWGAFTKSPSHAAHRYLLCRLGVGLGHRRGYRFCLMWDMPWQEPIRGTERTRRDIVREAGNSLESRTEFLRENENLAVSAEKSLRKDTV